jgi:hypothetical protein
MYGVTCTQTYTYFARNTRSEPILKLVVLSLIHCRGLIMSHGVDLDSDPMVCSYL